jgi:hypothetical protein
VTRIKDLAIQLFKSDPPPSARLAYLLRVRQRQAQYWLSGKDWTPPDILQTLEGQIAAVEKFDLEGRVDKLIDEAAANGIDLAVVAHYLATAVNTGKD